MRRKNINQDGYRLNSEPHIILDDTLTGGIGRTKYILHKTNPFNIISRLESTCQSFDIHGNSFFCEICNMYRAKNIICSF